MYTRRQHQQPQSRKPVDSQEEKLETHAPAGDSRTTLIKKACPTSSSPTPARRTLSSEKKRDPERFGRQETQQKEDSPSFRRPETARALPPALPPRQGALPEPHPPRLPASPGRVWISRTPPGGTAIPDRLRLAAASADAVSAAWGQNSSSSKQFEFLYICVRWKRYGINKPLGRRTHYLIEPT